MFMIEGEWLGYRSNQDHVCYREYFPKARKNFVESVKKIGFGITFTDGTTLRLSVHEVARRKLPEKTGYGELVRQCAWAGVNSVEALTAKKEGTPS